jgi:ABC transporter ATP-binding protein (multidrug resistance protein)
MMSIGNNKNEDKSGVPAILTQFKEAIGFCSSIAYKASAFYTVLRLLFSILPSVISLLQTVLAKYILDLLTGAYTADNIYQSLLLFFALELLLTITMVVVQKVDVYVQTVHGELIENQLSLLLMNKSFMADIEHFDNPYFYDKLTSCTTDSMAIINLVWNALMLTGACVSVVISFSAIMKYNVLYSMLMLCAAIPASIVSTKYTKSIYSLSLEQLCANRQKNYIQSISTSKAYVMNIKLYQAGSWLIEKYQRIWTKLFRERKTVNKRRCLISSVLECLPEIVAIYIGIDTALDVIGHKATIGDYSLFCGLAAQLSTAVITMLSSFVAVYDNQQKTKNFRSLDNLFESVENNGTIELDSVHSITFDHVCFTYPGSQTPALNDVSFSVGRGEHIAIVGTNGSGKSTVIKLLLRFYDVNSGRILINGHEIRMYPLEDLRNAFSAYFQAEPYYGFTVRENLTIADRNRPDENQAIISALNVSGARDIIESIPDGIETYLTRMFDEKGIELSGGQYQRISLARTFFRRCSALILDEPTSSLDPETEHKLFSNLKKLNDDKIVIYISHRLSNVFVADKVIVLENGVVVEMGNSKDLMHGNGRLSELLNYQHQLTELQEAKHNHDNCHN